MAGQTYMGPARAALRTQRYKYIHCFRTRSFKPYIEVPPAALYDMESDPYERRNLVDERPDVAARMREELLQLRQDDLPLSLALDDPVTRKFLPALGLEQHARRLIDEGRPNTVIPDLDDASPELREILNKLQTLGSVN